MRRLETSARSHPPATTNSRSAEARQAYPERAIPAACRAAGADRGYGLVPDLPGARPSSSSIGNGPRLRTGRSALLGGWDARGASWGGWALSTLTGSPGRSRSTCRPSWPESRRSAAGRSPAAATPATTRPTAADKPSAPGDQIWVTPSVSATTTACCSSIAARYRVEARRGGRRHRQARSAMRDRFVICRNPDEAARDAAIRGQILEQLRAAIAGSDDRSPAEREELACRLCGKPTYRRFLRTTAGGLLRIDRAAVTADARLDGKFLLRTSDPTLSAADVATGYKQLLEVERAWRDMKTTLDLRPVYHRREARIRAHVLLCWLALLLIRIAETATGETWRSLAWELDKLHLGRFVGPAGEVHQRTETTPRQAAIFKALAMPEPPRFLHLAPAAPAAS